MKKSINQILGTQIYNKIYFLPSLILLSFLLRLITVYFIRDYNIDNEWGVLLDNFIKNKSYSLSYEGQLIPTVLLPPAYPLYLYLIKSITSFTENNLLNTIIFTQVILSTFSVYLFFQISRNFFSKNLSILSAFIFSIIPLNIYSCGQISSVNLQIVFSLLFLKFLFLIIQKQSIYNLFFFSIFTGLLLLTRGEFILIFLIVIFYVYLKKKIKTKNLLKIFIIVSLVIFPYLARNYMHFNQIMIVKSLGYNLWKGNNEVSTVEGYENLGNENFINLNKKLKKITINKRYEINRDKVFFNHAMENLNENPKRYILLFFKKIAAFYFFDINSRYPNYYNLFHIFPIIIISILSLPGLFLCFKKKEFLNNCLNIYLFSNLIIFSIFFILPRYKLAILPIQIILIIYFLKYVLNKLKNK